jgi:outer membrane protein OmpA-like peptidoglycan-associated protein
MRARRDSAGLAALVLAGACAAPRAHRDTSPEPVGEPVAEVAAAPEVAPPSAPDADATASTMPAPGDTPRRRVVTTSTTMTVLEPVQFIGASAAIDPSSSAMLDAIATTFVDNTDLELIEVRAYGFDAPPGSRLELGRARAAHIVEALVARGVSRGRLRPVGFATGASSPGPELVILRRRNDA